MTTLRGKVLNVVSASYAALGPMKMFTSIGFHQKALPKVLTMFGSEIVHNGCVESFYGETMDINL